MRRLSSLLLSLLALPSLLAAQGKVTLPVSLGELEKRAVADSNDASAHYNVALGYWNAKRWDDVERSLRTAIKLEPRFAQAHLALAYLPIMRYPKFWDRLYELNSAWPEDIKSIIATFDREYRHAFLIDPMVDLRIIAAATPAGADQWEVKDNLGDIWALYFQGRIDCYEGNYAQCEGKYTRLIGELREARAVGNLPDDMYWFRGLAAAHEKHFDVALGDFNKLIEREQDRAKKIQVKGMIRLPLRENEYRYFLATFTHASGNVDGAVPLYKEALEKDLGLYMAHVRLANIYEAKRDFEGAVAERRYAVNANPDDASLLVDLGVTLGRSGAFPEAAVSLRGATQRMPRNTEAWFWLGIAESQLGRKAEAKAAFEQVIALAPSRLKARADQAKQRIATLQ